MKIYIKSDGRTVCAKDETVVTCTEALRLCCDTLIAIGYHPDSISEALNEILEESNFNKETQNDVWEIEDFYNTDDMNF